MFLKSILIENFRGITKLSIDLNNTTVLIGENNAGKTSVLEALFACMNRVLSRRSAPFSEYDFHLATKISEPSDAPPIVITLVFEERKKDEWPKEIDQILEKTVQLLDDERRRISFRVSSKYEKATNDFSVEWCFLDKDGNILPTAKNPKLVSDLQLLAPVFYLSAVRDATQHFNQKSPFWGSFTKNPKIDEAKRKEIEEQIEKINQSVLDGHQPFEVIKEKLAQVADFLPLGPPDLVSIEAIPARIFDMLSKTQVKLTARTGASLPIAQHGAGTQSLSILFLFEAFLHSQLTEVYEKATEPLLALEEPELHLHPSAIRSLWGTIEKFAGQKIIATHSGDLLAAVPLKSIRRLARKNGTSQIFYVKDSTLDPEEEQKVTYHVRSKRGALMFARCWLFVEGETEFILLPELARLMGKDFVLAGVCCVEFAQCRIDTLIKVADDLGIEWHALTDGDQAGKDYAKTVKRMVGKVPEIVRLSTLAEDNMEECMWAAGFHGVFENSVDQRHKQLITATPGSRDYIKQTIEHALRSTSKPQLAYAIINEMETSGKIKIPDKLKTAIEVATKLAKKSS